MGPLKALESARCTQAGLEESQHRCCELPWGHMVRSWEWPLGAKISPLMDSPQREPQSYTCKEMHLEKLGGDLSLTESLDEDAANWYLELNGVLHSLHGDPSPAVSLPIYTILRQWVCSKSPGLWQLTTNSLHSERRTYLQCNCALWLHF